MTHATRDFVWVMRIYAVIYFVGALLFFFMPEEIFYLINVGPRVFKIYDEIPMPSEHFWVALSTSMMMMLCFASVYSSVYPKIKGFIGIHMVSKITSVIGFTYLFLHGPQHGFAYLFGAITDSSVIVVVLGFYLRSVTSRGEVPSITEEPAVAAAGHAEG
ncbi:MAG: hypothetical protein HY075_11425 [Deltaproteobacteria bacterium]|nr:hypothetical protein [Deltaproteobacteria bacterium]